MPTQFVLNQHFCFDVRANTLSVLSDGKADKIRLGSNESQMLLVFCSYPNQVLSRDELYKYVWQEHGFEVDDSSLTQAISTLRKLLGDSPKTPQYIKTVPKRGYQLICSVERFEPTLTACKPPTDDSVPPQRSGAPVAVAHRGDKNSEQTANQAAHTDTSADLCTDANELVNRAAPDTQKRSVTASDLPPAQGHLAHATPKERQGLAWHGHSNTFNDKLKKPQYIAPSAISSLFVHTQKFRWLTDDKAQKRANATKPIVNKPTVNKPIVNKQLPIISIGQVANIKTRQTTATQPPQKEQSLTQEVLPTKRSWRLECQRFIDYSSKKRQQASLLTRVCALALCLTSLLLVTNWLISPPQQGMSLVEQARYKHMIIYTSTHSTGIGPITHRLFDCLDKHLSHQTLMPEAILVNYEPERFVNVHFLTQGHQADISSLQVILTDPNAWEKVCL